MTPEQDIECLRYLAKFKGDDDVLGDVPYTLLESVADRLERLTAENERLRGRNAALVESLRAHRCLVDNRATVGECQQCGCIDGLLISGDTQQLTPQKE